MMISQGKMDRDTMMSICLEKHGGLAGQRVAMVTRSCQGSGSPYVWTANQGNRRPRGNVGYFREKSLLSVMVLSVFKIIMCKYCQKFYVGIWILGYNIIKQKCFWVYLVILENEKDITNSGWDINCFATNALGWLNILANSMLIAV